MNHNNIFLVGKQNGETQFKELNFDAHQQPVFEADKRNNWIEYGTSKSIGKEYKNNYPNYLIYLYNSSSVHNSIINEKVNFITGQGWSVNSDKPEGIVSLARLEQFIKHPNKEESLNTLTKKVALDKKLYGGYSVQVILNGKNDISEVFHIDFGNIRRNKEDRNLFYYTSDWDTRKPEKNEDFEKLYAFPFDRDEIKEDRKYIIYVQEYRPQQKEYPLPDYVASNPYIEADYEIGNFVLNNTKNGFTAGFLANFFNGQPSEEAKQAIDKEFDNMFTGSDQAGKVLKNFSEGKEYGLELTPIQPNGQDDRYINLEKTITNKIFIGAQMPPALIDSVAQTSGLGNNADEKRVSMEKFQSSYVDNEQTQIEELFNSIVGFNGLPEELEITKLKPIKIQFTENMLSQIYDVDELREMDGAKPKEVTKTVTKEFSADVSSMLERFKSEDFGIDKNTLEVVKSKQYSIIDLEDAVNKEIDFKFISQTDAVLLNMLKAGVPKPTILKALEIDSADYDARLDSLKDEGIVSEDGQVINESPVIDEEFFIVYTYVKRSDVKGDELLDTSRDFCKQMVNLTKSKAFTIEDIKQISAVEGRDVFRTRGGWYNNNGVNTPYCRHVWQAELVRLK